MKKSNHDGFPVIANGNLVGIVTTRDLVFKGRGKNVKDVMTNEVIVTFPDTNLTDAARVMFRRGYSRLPVVDKDQKVIGIVTVIDVIRSHIERVTPGKIKKLTDSYEKLYGIKTDVRLGVVRIDELIPTQPRVMPGEFEGREYELKRGLAEPILVVKVGDRKILVDGHHRALAADGLGMYELDAYIITMSKDTELGIEKTAREQGLKSVKDIKIVKDLDRGIVGVIIGDETIYSG
jgi:IMP dehydrogenase